MHLPLQPSGKEGVEYFGGTQTGWRWFFSLSFLSGCFSFLFFFKQYYICFLFFETFSFLWIFLCIIRFWSFWKSFSGVCFPFGPTKCVLCFGLGFISQRVDVKEFVGYGVLTCFNYHPVRVLFWWFNQWFFGTWNQQNNTRTGGVLVSCFFFLTRLLDPS